jgi:putative endonuclease
VKKLDIKLRGVMGEQAVCDYLKEKRFTILKRNFSCRYGEVDIIATDREFILFCEVKTRGRFSLASPASFVTKQKQRRIITAALFFLSGYNTDLQPRFDVFEVFLNDDLPPVIEGINHIENAFYAKR